MTSAQSKGVWESKHLVFSVPIIMGELFFPLDSKEWGFLDGGSDVKPLDKDNVAVYTFTHKDDLKVY